MARIKKTTKSDRQRVKNRFIKLEAFRLLLQEIGSKGKLFVFLQVALAIIRGVLAPAILLQFGLVVDVLQDRSNSSTMLPTLFIWVGCTVFLALAGEIVAYFSAVQSDYISDKLSGDIHTTALELGLEEVLNSDTQDLLHRAFSFGPNRPVALVKGGVNILQSMISLGAMTVIMLQAGVVVILISALGVIPHLFLRRRIAKNLFFWEKENTTKNRRAGYFSFILTSKFFLPEVKTQRCGKFFADKFLLAREKIRDSRRVVLKKNILISLFLATYGGTVHLAGAYLIVNKGLHGAFSVGTAVVLLSGFGTWQRLLKDISNSWVKISKEIDEFGALLDFKKLSKTFHSPLIEEPPFLMKGQWKLIVDKVVFSYPGSKTPTIKELSCQINPGEILVICGKNGAGKSTLGRLVSGDLLPQSGDIYVKSEKGKKDYCHARYCRMMTQELGEFCVSLVDNISFDDDSDSTEQRIRTACEFSGIDRMIAKNQISLDEELGEQFPGGRWLSRGQWQRVAFSRLIFSDSKIIILDEPTSALDSSGKELFISSINKLKKANKAIIIISHKKYFTNMADQIIRL